MSLSNKQNIKLIGRPRPLAADTNTHKHTRDKMASSTTIPTEAAHLSLRQICFDKNYTKKYGQEYEHCCMSRKDSFSKEGRKENMNSSSSRDTRAVKTKALIMGIVGFLSVILLIELVCILPMMFASTVTTMQSVKNVFQFVVDNEDMIETGAAEIASMMIPGAGSPPPVMPTLKGGADGNTTNTAPAATDDPNDAIFKHWCSTAPCMQNNEIACEDMLRDLNTGKRPNGSPVIPFPAEFCGVMDTLSSSQCLCDPDLGDADKMGDLAQLIGFAPVVGNLCKIDIISPKSGNC